MTTKRKHEQPIDKNMDLSDDSEINSPPSKKIQGPIAELINSINATNQQVQTYLAEKGSSLDPGMQLLLQLMSNQAASCALLIQQFATPTQHENSRQYGQPPSYIDPEEKERRRSVVISGLAEATGVPSSRAAADLQSVTKLMDEIDAETTIVSSYRLGNKTHPRGRLLKVVFATSSQQFNALKKAKQLKNSIQFKGVYIRPSLTVEQRIKEKQLWDEYKKLKESNTCPVRIVGGLPGNPNRKVIVVQENQ